MLERVRQPNTHSAAGVAGYSLLGNICLPPRLDTRLLVYEFANDT